MLAVLSVAAGSGWAHGQRPDPNGRHLMLYDNSAATTKVVIRHNIFCRATDSLLRLQGRDWTAALVRDWNCWHQPRGPVLPWGRQTIGADEFADFLHARGLDRHSLLADPKCVDSAQRDYRQAPDSPASFAAELFHFGARPRDLEAELFLLSPGEYEMPLTAAGAGQSPPL